MNSSNDKKYDLEERTFAFAKNVIDYVRDLPKGMSYSEIGKQLMRSAGSAGANDIEADKALSRKDSVMRIKIRKYTLLYTWI